MIISIIIPTFNYDKYIARAIRSCIEQSFPKKDFEIIVINDSSNDSTRYILESYGHWIRVIDNHQNKGLPSCRNQGIMNANGEFILNLDADDYLHKDFLNICYLTIFFNNYDAVATDYFLVNDNEEIIKRMSVKKAPIACGILFRKQQMIDVGLYDSELRIGEDVDFRIRFDKCYTVKQINLPLYRYRMHKKNNTSNKIKNKHYIKMVEQKNSCTNLKISYHAEKLCL